MSKFDLSASVCRKLLSPVFKTINHSTVLPSLGGVMINNCDGGIRFTSSDLENTVQAHLPLMGLSPMDFCIHGKLLSSVINNAIEDSISVSIAKNKASFNSGGFRVSLPADPSSEFPKIPVLEKEKTLVLDSSIIHKKLSAAIRFVSNDNLRPAMTGVCLVDYNKELHAVATDAHRLYWGAIIKTPTVLSGISSIISQKCVRLFLDIFKSGNVEVSMSSQYIRFKSSTHMLISRLIDSSYPMFSQVIPKNDIQFCCIRKQMIAFLRMAAPFVNKSTNRIDLEISKDSIRVKGGDADFENELSYKMPVYHTDKMPDALSFSLNLKFLRDQLSISSDEYCKFLHSGNPLKPVIIDDHSLLMPLMTNQ